MRLLPKQVPSDVEAVLPVNGDDTTAHATKTLVPLPIAVAKVEDGIVTAVNIIDGGGKYATAPTVTIVDTYLGGEQANLAVGSVQAVSTAVTAGGLGYEVDDVLTVVDDTGTAATFKVDSINQVAGAGGVGGAFTETVNQVNVPAVRQLMTVTLTGAAPEGNLVLVVNGTPRTQAYATSLAATLTAWIAAYGALDAGISIVDGLDGSMVVSAVVAGVAFTLTGVGSDASITVTKSAETANTSPVKQKHTEALASMTAGTLIVVVNGVRLYQAFNSTIAQTITDFWNKYKVGGTTPLAAVAVTKSATEIIFEALVAGTAFTIDTSAAVTVGEVATVSLVSGGDIIVIGSNAHATTSSVNTPAARIGCTLTIKYGVKSITITAGGINYIEPCNITVGSTGGGVTAGTLLGVLTNGVITGATVVTAGEGLAMNSAVVVDGDPVNATATCTIDVDGYVQNITVTNGGSGHLNPPLVSFSSGTDMTGFVRQGYDHSFLTTTGSDAVNVVKLRKETKSVSISAVPTASTFQTIRVSFLNRFFFDPSRQMGTAGFALGTGLPRSLSTVVGQTVPTAINTTVAAPRAIVLEVPKSLRRNPNSQVGIEEDVYLIIRTLNGAATQLDINEIF
jgi:hypothetical protein